jgi:quercetin dioxygenase-like cupin family protein
MSTELIFFFLDTMSSITGGEMQATANETPWRETTLMGVTIRIKADAQETNGAFSLIEMVAPPFFPGAPAHYHREMSESFFVIEGSLEVTLDGKVRSLGAGEFAIAQKGTMHAFRNATDQPVHFLFWAIPGGHDRFFVELVEWMRREPEWPPRDAQKLAAFGLRHDTYYA